MRRPRSARLAVVVLASACALGACSGGAGAGGSTSAAAPPTVATTPAVSPSAAPSRPASRTTPAPASTTPVPTPTPASTAPARATPTSGSRSTPAGATARRSLPLSGTTAGADQVITVVASSSSSTTAELQAWNRVDGGWATTGPQITAHVGSGGVGTASEGSTRTPAGSFTLTQAFGHDADPGTRLPYTHTTPADWWISQSSSPLYNTRQRCASGCSFTLGDPNEHLYYETPFYDYAVVIDYNTTNAPGGVRPGAGSAFFLHVTDGNPTAGCVSVPQSRLVTIMRWLDPTKHPRILIGVQ